MGDITNISKSHSPAAEQVSSSRTFLHIRNAAIYTLVYTAVAAAVSYLFIIPIIPGNTNLKLIAVPAFSYLLLGILFAGFLYTKLDFLNRLNLSGGLQYAAIVFICLFSVTLLTGIIKKNGSVVTSLFYSCIFLLPYLVYQTWIFYHSLAGSGYNKIWYPPEQAFKAPAATISLNSVRIRIKVAPLDGAAEKLYDITVPGKFSVGTAFANFMYGDEKTHADKIVFKDENNRLFGWQFFTSDFLGLVTRPVDPDLNLFENNIKDNSIIIARRIQKQFT